MSIWKRWFLLQSDRKIYNLKIHETYKLEFNSNKHAMSGIGDDQKLVWIGGLKLNSWQPSIGYARADQYSRKDKLDDSERTLQEVVREEEIQEIQ